MACGNFAILAMGNFYYACMAREKLLFEPVKSTGIEDTAFMLESYGC